MRFSQALIKRAQICQDRDRCLENLRIRSIPIRMTVADRARLTEMRQESIARRASLPPTEARSGDMIPPHARATEMRCNRWMLPIFALAVLCQAMVGCVSSSERSCLSVVGSNDLLAAEQLIRDYITVDRGSERAKSFFSRYELEKSEACGDSILLAYRPLSKPLPNGNVVVGSKVQYTVDLADGSVVETYLD